MSKKNRRRKERKQNFNHTPGSIRGAAERYRFMWTAEGNRLELRERIAVTWQLIFALRWFVMPAVLALALVLVYVVAW